MTPAVLLTGGLGYIGSHACLVLATAGRRVVIADNLSNAKSSVFERLRSLAPEATLAFHKLDLRDGNALRTLFADSHIGAVIHFAGLKSVAESVEKPSEYHDNNVGGTRSLLDAMRNVGVRRIVFSSSATVYGRPEKLPIQEEHPLRPENPYGETKLQIERLLAHEAARNPEFRFAALRYFNPVGAHPTGALGEDPLGTPANLFPLVTQVATGRRPMLRVFGNDWETPDGTGVRDYLHVLDLAEGHLGALSALERDSQPFTVNLGTGLGHSVLEVVRAFERENLVRIPLEFAPRRPGDVAACVADPTKAERMLGWKAKRGLEEMCRDAWRWQTRNPDGYPD